MTGVEGLEVAGEERPLPKMGDALLCARRKNRRLAGEEDTVISSLEAEEDSDEFAECVNPGRDEKTVT